MELKNKNNNNKKYSCSKEYQFTGNCRASEYTSSWEMFCQNCLEMGFFFFL